jgi:hypothetical protein
VLTKGRFFALYKGLHEAYTEKSAVLLLLFVERCGIMETGRLSPHAIFETMTEHI